MKLSVTFLIMSRSDHMKFDPRVIIVMRHTTTTRSSHQFAEQSLYLVSVSVNCNHVFNKNKSLLLFFVIWQFYTNEGRINIYCLLQPDYRSTAHAWDNAKIPNRKASDSRVIHLKHTRSSLQLQQATLRLKTSKLTALLSTLVIIALSRLPSQTTRMALSFSPPHFPSE